MCLEKSTYVIPFVAALDFDKDQLFVVCFCVFLRCSMFCSYNLCSQVLPRNFNRDIEHGFGIVIVIEPSPQVAPPDDTDLPPPHPDAAVVTDDPGATEYIPEEPTPAGQAEPETIVGDTGGHTNARGTAPQVLDLTGDEDRCIMFLELDEFNFQLKVLRTFLKK